LLASYKEAVTYVMTFQLDLSFLTKDLKPLFGVNSSPLDELKMIVLLCCPSAFSAVASCEDENKIVTTEQTTTSKSSR